MFSDIIDFLAAGGGAPLDAPFVGALLIAANVAVLLTAGVFSALAMRDRVRAEAARAAAVDQTREARALLDDMRRMVADQGEAMARARAATPQLASETEGAESGPASKTSDSRGRDPRRSAITVGAARLAPEADIDVVREDIGADARVRPDLARAPDASRSPDNARRLEEARDAASVPSSLLRTRKRRRA